MMRVAGRLHPCARLYMAEPASIPSGSAGAVHRAVTHLGTAHNRAADLTTVVGEHKHERGG
jgi:hypothetical protein